ncbi:MAG: AAA family ATPase [Boseongicola sp. SB0677_bin_26]|nr:AAA family ATPase [Boseongicola sp. SB0665_bin_10]MYG27620.1 AAA family ATPase [Boseongicola sp. SB0677_bin_26]
MRPVLIVVAGPNGSGKTSLTRDLLMHRWIEGCHYVNPDDIAKDMFGDWNDPDAVLKAAQEATRQRHECLKSRRSLAFETVLSSSEKLQFLHGAKNAGFFARMFFVGTDSPRINAARVAGRVMEGGHDVPNVKIIERFGKSLANLAAAIPICDRVYVYDNSIDHQDARLQFRTVDGFLARTYETTHAWAEFLRAPLADLQPSHDPDDGWTPPEPSPFDATDDPFRTD